MDFKQRSGLGTRIQAVDGFRKRLQESGWSRGGGLGQRVFIQRLGIWNNSRAGVAGRSRLFTIGNHPCRNGKRRESTAESGVGINPSGVFGRLGGANGKPLGGREGPVWVGGDSRDEGWKAVARALREIYDS